MADMVTLATRINEAHAACEAAIRSGAQHAADCGEALLQAKDNLPHGQWLGWLAENCPAISVRSVQAYMRIARGMLGPNAQRVAHLSVREALRVLSEPVDPLAANRQLIDESRQPVAALEERLNELLDRKVTDENRGATLCALAGVAAAAGEWQNRLAEAHLRAERAAGEILNHPDR